MVNNRLRYCFEIKKGKVPKKLYEDKVEGSFPYLSMDYVRSGTIDTYSTEGVLVEKCSCCLLWDGANAGEMFVNNTAGYLSSTCAVLVPHQKIQKEMAYWYLVYCEDILRKQTNGMGIPHVDAEILKNIVVPVHDLPTQTKIASFLDKKIPAINELIDKETLSIEKLLDYRKALITDSLTKGLSSSSILKDSGVDWMGKIKQTYCLKRMKYACVAANGLTYSPDDVVEEDEGGILVLRSSNIQESRLVFDDNVYVKLKDVPLLKSGDILLCSRNGSAALIGKNAIINENNVYSYGAFMMSARPNKGYLSRYFYYLLNSNVFSHYLSSFLTTTINQLTKGNFYSMVVPLCEDLEEQQQIVDFLDRKCGAIDELISIKRLKIEKLKEYKKSLVYECVTGRRKV